jgi:ATP-dependent Clp protease ATP-binding subunit ClpA
MRWSRAAQLAARYVSDRFLPDKAIDLIDEAGSRMRLRRMTAPPGRYLRLQPRNLGVALRHNGQQLLA